MNMHCSAGSLEGGLQYSVKFFGDDMSILLETKLGGTFHQARSSNHSNKFKSLNIFILLITLSTRKFVTLRVNPSFVPLIFQSFFY